MTFQARVVDRVVIGKNTYEVVDEGKGRMTRIPEHQLHSFINRPIHLSWAPKGCVWILEKLETLPNGKLLMHLVTPVRDRRRTSYADKACFTNQCDPLDLGGVRKPGSRCRKHVVCQCPVRQRRELVCACGTAFVTWDGQQKWCSKTCPARPQKKEK